MSVYSTDSLEDSNEISSKKQDFLRENANEYNPKVIEDLTYLSPGSTLNLQSTVTKKDTGTNETTPGVATDKGTGTAGSRNAIIANRRLADASKRRRPTSSRNGKRDVADRFKRNNADNSKQEEDGNGKRVAIRSSKRLPKTVPPKRGCFAKDNPMPMKSDKKLGDVLAPRIHPARKPRSYLELYRRRFSGPQYCVRSPEGSTLSVCGDSEQEKLSDDDDDAGTRSFPTPRDDQSELSFYRRIMEGSLDPLASAARSNGAVQRCSPHDTNTISSSTNRTKRNGSDDKSKTLSYRPYTIEEYKTLPIPKLDRSLGPDKVEMQAKREWLMRRRSYGNSVSARNRQRILLQAHRLKQEDAIAEKCFLPPLKDHGVDAKMRCDSTCSTISEDQETIRRNGSTSGSRYPRKHHNHSKISSARRSKKFERTSSFCSSLNSYGVVDDSYLESLRQRHLYEKEMVDRIIN